MVFTLHSFSDTAAVCLRQAACQGLTSMCHNASGVDQLSEASNGPCRMSTYENCAGPGARLHEVTSRWPFGEKDRGS